MATDDHDGGPAAAPPDPANALCGRTLLLVEDEVFTRHVVSRYLLRGSGCTIHCTDSGTDALARIERLGNRIDGVIGDLDPMPGHGLDLLRAIRAGDTALRRHCPVLLLTGLSEGPLLKAAWSLDANGFLAKPLSRAALVQRLAACLEATPLLRPVATYRAVALPQPAGRDGARQAPPQVPLWTPPPWAIPPLP